MFCKSGHWHISKAGDPIEAYLFKSQEGKKCGPKKP
jgi:hypothetical protein